uniref:(northern house mosquito) hypothetical protein n=1 Tax=Culex pipiens TaxID=7175 RepID=A0A8D8CU63_CULPI
MKVDLHPNSNNTSSPHFWIGALWCTFGVIIFGAVAVISCWIKRCRIQRTNIINHLSNSLIRNNRNSSNNSHRFHGQSNPGLSHLHQPLQHLLRAVLHFLRHPQQLLSPDLRSGSSPNYHLRVPTDSTATNSINTKPRHLWPFLRFLPPENHPHQRSKIPAESSSNLLLLRSLVATISIPRSSPSPCTRQSTRSSRVAARSSSACAK